MEPAGPELPNPALSRARGRIQREVLSRSDHADLAPRPAGFDAVAALEAQARGRVPSLLPVRYARMVADEGGFYRGAAALMAADLAEGASTDLMVQLCGDAHLLNFGAYRSPEGRLVFDVDDFDETLPGPFEWDVKRLAASIAVAATHGNLAAAAAERAVLEAVGQYRAVLRGLAGKGTLATWHARLDLEHQATDLRGALVDVFSREAETTLRATKPPGRRRDYARLLIPTDDGPRLASRPPLLVPVSELDDDGGAPGTYRFLLDALRAYEATITPAHRHLVRQFLPVDAARKVVGVGSVGMRCYVVLLLGRDVDDPFVLQVKEATTSVLEAHLGPSKTSSHGERVVTGQELLQAAPDDFLGWLDLPGDPETRSFYVRQLYDGRSTLDIRKLDAGLLRGYASLCGWTLARAHARTGDRVAISSYLGKSDAFDEAIGDFALAYALRNHEDYESLRAAVASGRITTA